MIFNINSYFHGRCQFFPSSSIFVADSPNITNRPSSALFSSKNVCITLLVHYSCIYKASICIRKGSQIRPLIGVNIELSDFICENLKSILICMCVTTRNNKFLWSKHFNGILIHILISIPDFTFWFWLLVIPIQPWLAKGVSGVFPISL